MAPCAPHSTTSHHITSHHVTSNLTTPPHLTPSPSPQGDVLVTNHPTTAGGSHLPDITVITPVFASDATGTPQVVFFVASRGHHADIGGETNTRAYVLLRPPTSVAPVDRSSRARARTLVRCRYPIHPSLIPSPPHPPLSQPPPSLHSSLPHPQSFTTIHIPLPSPPQASPQAPCPPTPRGWWRKVRRSNPSSSSKGAHSRKRVFVNC